MLSLSCIKSRLPIIIRPLISPNHHHHHVPITQSITQLITLNFTKNNLLFNNKNVRFFSSSSNNKCYSMFQCLVKGVKSHCTLPRLALAAAMSMVRIERVPFTDRYHVVLRGPKFTWIPSNLRDKYIDCWISVLFQDRKYETLASTSTKVVPVITALYRIVTKMHSLFGLEKESTVTTYQSPRMNSDLHRLYIQYTIGSPTNHPSTLFGSTRYATKHLEGREWKVAVIESPEKNIGLLQNCTIFITTGLMNTLSYLELATLMARQIGHYIAQHRFDTLFGTFHGYKKEIEADYISLMLLASMGYDPRKVIKVYEKECYKDKRYSCRKRMESLQNDEKMEKLMNAYRQAKSDEDIKVKIEQIFISNKKRVTTWSKDI